MGLSSQSMREITVRGIILGALITVVFTASNVYLGLKVGLTFSSSIPAAVISMAILSLFSHSNILENNMVQTQASAAGTLSSVIFVVPALLMIGYWQSFPFWQTMMICSAGGFLGVIFSIPLRRTMVVNSPLPYPEGVAAAEILHVGHSDNEEDKGGAKEIMFGAIISSVVSFFTAGLHLLSDSLGYWFSSGRAIFQIPAGFSLALMSAGYLMGFYAGIAMLIGTILTWFVLVPYLAVQSEAMQAVATTDLGAMMDVANVIWKDRVRLIGAGAIAISAIWTLITLFRPMIEGVRLSIRSLQANSSEVEVDRTDLDMSPKSLLIVTAITIFVLALVFHSFVQAAPISPLLSWGLVAFAVVITFIIGFFIAAACGYMAGLIGSSNSPVSGIGIIAIITVSSLLMLIGSCTDLLSTGEGKQFAMALALFITSGVVAVASISNDNLQDLKTGYLVGATPKNQQIALLIGCVVGAMVIAPILDILYQAYGLAGAPLPREGMDTSSMLSAPQASLMTTIAKSIFSQTMDWAMIIVGLIIGAVVIVIDAFFTRKGYSFRIPALAVGLGIYLPADVNVPVAVGSVLSWLIPYVMAKKGLAAEQQEKALQLSNRKGVLMASGIIVGESLMGVFLAIAILISLSMGFSDSPFGIDATLAAIFGKHLGLIRDLSALVVFCGICWIFYKRTFRIKVQ